jgi:hypothetical protein
MGLGSAYARNRLAPLPLQPHEYRIAGEWLAENHPPGLILTRKPQVGYYSGNPTIGPDGEDTIASAVAKARAIGARYLIVDERYTAKLIPGIAPLLNPANAPPSLKLLKAGLSPYPQGRIVIYQVLPDGQNGDDSDS